MKKLSITTRAVAIIILGSVLFSLSVYGAYQASLTIHNSGWIGVVGVFSDVNCTLPVQTLNWSTVYPGATVNQTVYIKNFGDKAVTVNMTTINWLPLNASQFITVTWDHEGMTVNPGAEQAIIYLTVNSSVNGTTGISSFSFDININEAWA